MGIDPRPQRFSPYRSSGSIRKPSAGSWTLRDRRSGCSGHQASCGKLQIRAARPLAGATPAEAGAGFVDTEIVIGHLAALTGSDVVRLFAPESEPDNQGLIAIRPFSVEGLRQLNSVLNQTGPTIKFDYETGRFAALPLVDDALRKEYPNGIEIDLTGIQM